MRGQTLYLRLCITSVGLDFKRSKILCFCRKGNYFKFYDLPLQRPTRYQNLHYLPSYLHYFVQEKITPPKSSLFSLGLWNPLVFSALLLTCFEIKEVFKMLFASYIYFLRFAVLWIVSLKLFYYMMFCVLHIVCDLQFENIG